jgi:hypothetical protein
MYEDGTIALSATVENETVWLSQKQMGELFGKSTKTISEHINNIFKEGELDKNAVIRKFRIVQTELALLVVASVPEQKDIIIKLMTNMLYEGDI